ncbi:hypothetical protein [Isoptericola cucumis]|uniref:Uncharacterized protein n=1 Tax=Isoptericola cucumis TaxID=1776856 RepID=A0ABQ2B9I3_9MICO|nr:hypothetical protein [Isoptericola cucumis]GGI10959.1 hypothetical protein GCM10007368_33820 [Isoptericola cucumis]
MDANPSALARASRQPRPSPARPPHAPPVDAPPVDAVRRPTRGDLLTVDPADRRRRAQTALLELVVTRSTERRRA